LAEGRVRQVEQPADFLPRVTREGEQGGDAEAGWQVRERGFAPAWFDGRPLRDLLTMRALCSVRTMPGGIPLAPAGGGAGVESGAVADDAGEPAAGFGG
jgi:hypothetical protein